jgi:hypothetical protein
VVVRHVKFVFGLVFCIYVSVVCGQTWFGGRLKTAASKPAIVSAAIDEKQIILTLSGEGKAKLVELAPYQNDEPQKFAAIWEGDAKTKKIKINRFDNKRDRLFFKFQLVDSAACEALGSPQYVTDFSRLKNRDFEMSWDKSFKGLACVRDVNDAIALGVKSADENLNINDIIDWRNTAPKAAWDVDGFPVPINMEYIEAVDRKLRQLTAAGINTTIIFLNKLPDTPDPNDPLIHPATDVKNSPWRLGMFNVTSDEGIRCYRAAIEFLADRYTRPDSKYGRISGFIIGNELQSHWVWCNIGLASPEKVADEYARAMRIADLAVRKIHRKLRVYVSLDHHWTHVDLMKDPLKEACGRELIERINERCKKEGNFPWYVAFHPYPENLFEPRTWLDRTATLSFDTQRITFKNLEVLPAFLQQDEFLYQGRPRRIILSEQGFNTPAGPDGEKIQAAAYAYAYHRASHLPTIDAFMYFTHVSSNDPMSAGLKLGLYDWDPNEPVSFKFGKKQHSWDVFRQADTPQWEQAFEFAKPIIGIKSWDEILPKDAIDNGRSAAEPHLN